MADQGRLTAGRAELSEAMSDDDLRRRCQPVIGSVLRDNGWGLASADDPAFVDAVSNCVKDRFPGRLDGSADVLDDAIRRATKYTYCTVLYAAYRQDGTDRQVLAMTEVKRFVYPRLLYKTKGDESLANECAQEAIKLAWLKWHTVRDPGTFLSFVLQIGIRAVLAAYRAADREADELDDDDDLSERPGLTTSNSLEQSAEEKSMLDRLYTVIRHCLSRENEVRIIIEHVVEGWPYKELAKAWGKSAAYLHLLKFRALDKLKKCDEFQKFLREWLGHD